MTTIKKQKSQKKIGQNHRTIQCENQLFGYFEIINNQNHRNCEAICMSQKVKLYVVSKIDFEIMISRCPIYLNTLLSNQIVQKNSLKNIDHNFQQSCRTIKENGNQLIGGSQKNMNVIPVPSTATVRTETEIVDHPAKKIFQNTF